MSSSLRAERTRPVERPALSGMACLDTSGNPRIPMLMEMVGAISRASTAQEVLRAFSHGMQRLDPDRQGYVSLSTRGLGPGRYRITRLITNDLPAHMDEDDPWHDVDAVTVHDTGFFRDIVRQAYPEIIHNVFLQDDPVVGDALKDFGSLMAVPLFDDGEPLNWAIMLHRRPDHYTVDDLEQMILRANLVGSTVRNVLAAQRILEAHARIRLEVEQIARIQRAMLPPELPRIPGVSLGASYETFDTAGGDLYDLTPLAGTNPDRTADPHDPWMIQIADASGHGPAAATVAAMLNAILNASPQRVREPGAMLSFANHHLCAKRLDGTFVTAILARFDPPSRRFTYARAGHNPLLLMTPRDRGMETRRLEEVGGLPLGITDELVYEEATVQLRPGQTVVFYTDGITEAQAPDATMFGVEGIERSLAECSGEPDCVIGHVTAALKAHEAGVRPSDDQTLLVMRMEGPAEPA